jgi:hypothetical protein
MRWYAALLRKQLHIGGNDEIQNIDVHPGQPRTTRGALGRGAGQTLLAFEDAIALPSMRDADLIALDDTRESLPRSFRRCSGIQIRPRRYAPTERVTHHP